MQNSAKLERLPASVNTHAALATDEPANTLRMIMLSVGHTCCIACIAESTDRTECVVPQRYQC